MRDFIGTIVILSLLGLTVWIVMYGIRASENRYINSMVEYSAVVGLTNAEVSAQSKVCVDGGLDPKIKYFNEPRSYENKKAIKVDCVVKPPPPDNGVADAAMIGAGTYLLTKVLFD